MELFDDVVVVDLGYSWRSDKARFFLNGPNPYRYPPWLKPTINSSIAGLNCAGLSAELEDVRRCVAIFEQLNEPKQKSMADRIENLRKVYFDHFSSWLERHEPDWVFAMNLTLPHAVSVTSALYAAADLHYRGRPGGLVFGTMTCAHQTGAGTTRLIDGFIRPPQRRDAPARRRASHQVDRRFQSACAGG